MFTTELAAIRAATRQHRIGRIVAGTQVHFGNLIVSVYSDVKGVMLVISATLDQSCGMWLFDYTIEGV